MPSRSEVSGIEQATRASEHTSKDKPDKRNILAYVHLRNIHGSTGAGRTARQITEYLALREDINLRILAEASDKARILPLVRDP